jgi:hypothetical protein
VTRPKAKTSRPAKPSAPHAFATIKTAVASLQPTIPQPAALPTTDAERDAVLDRIAPRKTWRIRLRDRLRAEMRQLKVDALWIWRRLLHLAGLVVYSFNVVASHIIAAMLYGISLVVFVLTIWELWTPAKAIADALAARMMQR